MKRMAVLSVFLVAGLGLLWGQGLAGDLTRAAGNGASAVESADRAFDAWDRGDYIPALETFVSLLQGPEGERYFERVALLSGELHPVRELTTDGRSARFSSTGRFAAFETGPRSAPVTHVLDARDGFASVASLNGLHAVFSPADDKVAYVRTKKSPDLDRMRQAVEAAAAAPAPDRAAMARLQQELAALEARENDLVVRDLATGAETRLDTGSLLKTTPRFSADGGAVYFVGAADAQAPAADIYAVSEGDPPRAVTSGDGSKTNPVVVPGGRYLLYQASAQSPFAGGGGGGGRPGGAAAARQFVVLDLERRGTTAYTGSTPAVAADGSAIAFLSQAGAEYSVHVVQLAKSLDPHTIKKTTDRISSVAISPDGSRVAWAMIVNRNLEVFVAGADGSGERRVSREIQHDQSPRFLTNTKLVAIKGESRHSRSHLYDLDTGSVVQLFHNNTLRTIAPEYEWATHPSGTALLIQAERDGDTISPERGVYAMDVSRTITKADLIERLERNLAAERRLRADGETLFRPIAAEVRAAVEQASLTRIYGYEEALFGFDSKYITEPGNKLAGEYLHRMFTSFGYQPEYQWFDARGNIRTANVLATLRGTASPDVVYVLSSHYDSNARCPGADDNNSGIAVLLETARVLARTPMPATIVFAAFTGEEAGLLGSREYVRQAVASGMQLAGALNNDMIGWTNDHRLDNTIRYSNAGIRDLQHAAAFLFSGMVTYDARYFRSTDAHAYYEAYGDIVGGFGSYPVLGNPHYHQATDLLDTVNHHLLFEATRANVASIMGLASSPARLKELRAVRTAAGTIEVTWSPAPEKDVTGYIVAWGPPGNPRAQTRTVGEPRVTLPAGEALHIAVKAVNSRGLTSWDWLSGVRS